MDSKELSDFAKRNIIPISLGALGLLLLVAGIFQAYSAKNSEPELVFEESEASQDESPELIIDVSGAVINPGVYKLKSNSRMVDALASAGGLSSEADRDFVEKNINLAGKVTDGIAKVKTQQPDLVLLDQVLPDIQGNEVLITLKSDPQTQNVPVAMLSNFGQNELIEKAINSGAVDYILKYQITPEFLATKIQELMKPKAPTEGQPV